MSKFSINILGCGSATPSMRHQPSCQIVDFRDNLFMIDCGEGAQLQMRRMKLKYQRLSHIFISHLHGDHVLGVPGLLSTFDLHGKNGAVTIHMFEEGIKVLKSVTDLFCKFSSFEIRYEPVPASGGTVFENNSLIVKAFPLSHSVPCVGYLFQEKPKPRHVVDDMIKFYNIPFHKIAAIKSGEDYVTPDGKIIANSHLTKAPDPQISYAYCSDTTFMPSLIDTLKGVDTIYHEATYDDSNASIAANRGHSTASQAATIAKGAGANRLIIGHFSKRYTSEEAHRQQAEAIFGKNVIVANEGMTIDLL